MIYLYAVTEPGIATPDETGLEDQPLRLAVGAEVAGLYSEHETNGFAPTADMLWHHDRIVEAAMSCGPVLPARFGTMFTQVSALSDALECDQARLRRQLERLRGCVELAVRVSLPASASSSPSNGQEYVAAKLAHRRDRRALAERTLVPLARHAVHFRAHGLDSDTGTMTASFLVQAADVEAFAERVRVLAYRHSELAFSCTGPWPPYSFAEEEA